jgi:hypothetical protein
MNSAASISAHGGGRMDSADFFLLCNRFGTSLGP